MPLATRPLGVTTDSDGGTIRVWSHNATAIELVVLKSDDPNWVVETVPLTRGDGDVWEATCGSLVNGARYALRADGPVGFGHDFDKSRNLLDPYARGLAQAPDRSWRGVVVESLAQSGFDWAGATKPNTLLDHSVLYELHVRGFSKLNPAIPERLRGTYAGLAHDASIDYLLGLGVTAVELLPVHAFVTESRLSRLGRANYWGYNTLAYFAPHAAYASPAAQAVGARAVRTEFAGMVQRLHTAGIEVILDVVYNHTAEEGPGGPTTSMRGLDNLGYYRQDEKGHYIDTTGCGNTLNFGLDAPQQLVLDSMRYWADELQVDGFRLDLAATLGRTARGEYTPDHPLIQAMLHDPILSTTKLIAEPWDVGMGGWQTGNFPAGFSEWNDGYRDQMRDFWLSDLRRVDAGHAASTGIGPYATRLAGSSGTFANDRGPLAGVNFVTAHDGFTLYDLTAYDEKHNLGNGEANRDGTSDNRSYNHGVEGPTADAEILAARRRSARNLMGSLLLSAGVPMLVAGDEFLRSQKGNNNAYCQDSELTWVSWAHDELAKTMIESTKRLIALRKQNPALRPTQYGRFGEVVPGASQMDWYDPTGMPMSIDDWNSPHNRTLLYLAASTPEFEEFNRVLIIVHAHNDDIDVVLPEHDGVTGYRKLWDSDPEQPATEETLHTPGERVTLAGQSMRLYCALGDQAVARPAPATQARATTSAV